MLINASFLYFTIHIKKALKISLIINRIIIFIVNEVFSDIINIQI